MRKRAFFLAFFLAVSSGGFARAEVGIGVSARSNDATIYLPVTLGERFMLEPFLRHARQTQRTGVSRLEVDSLAIGVGAFGMIAPAESFSIYFGGRVAYLDEETDVPSTGSPVLSLVGSNADLDGYSVAPTLGMQYRPMRRLSLGGEIAWEYARVDGRQRTASAPVLPPPLIPVPIQPPSSGVIAVPPTTDISRTTRQTRTSLILRFFF